MSSSARILVVDDDTSIRESLVRALQLEKYEVSAASDGAKGLDAVKNEQPDAIVLDVMMPGLDGPSTLSRIRETLNGASVPVVFLTAKAQPHERRALEALGVRGVIVKPFDPLSLADDLRSLTDID